MKCRFCKYYVGRKMVDGIPYQRYCSQFLKELRASELNEIKDCAVTEKKPTDKQMKLF